jgi:predicted nucleotide-binding protein
VEGGRDGHTALVEEFERAASPQLFVGAENVARELRFRTEAVAEGVNILASLKERLEFMDAPAEAGGMPDEAAGDEPDAAAKQIFIVHGHDDGLKIQVARLLEHTADHKITILHEQANTGNTLIEKFEEHAAEVGFAVVLLTGDDEGRIAGNEGDLRRRARQNVVFELGFFLGAIRRQKVAVLVEPGVEQPSDINGIVYIAVDEAGGWQFELLRELRAAGLEVDLNKLAEQTAALDHDANIRS